MDQISHPQHTGTAGVRIRRFVHFTPFVFEGLTLTFMNVQIPLMAMSKRAKWVKPTPPQIPTRAFWHQRAVRCASEVPVEGLTTDSVP